MTPVVIIGVADVRKDPSGEESDFVICSTKTPPSQDEFDQIINDC